MQGKFANATRNNQPSYDEPGKGSSDESDVEELSERGYEKDEYEVEVQAFMARGQGERQERVEAREVRRRREEGAAPAQPSAPVQPLVERVAQPRQARRKPVLEAQWQKYAQESWTIPIGMLAGRSQREVCGQAMLALRDALGRQQTRAQMATETGAIGGYLGPYHLKKALIDPGLTRTLVSEEFVNKHSIPMLMGSYIRIELANGQIEIPLGELLEPQRIETRESRRHWTCPSSDHVGYTIFCWEGIGFEFWEDQEIMVLAPLTVFPETEEPLYYGIHGMGVFQCKLRLTRLLWRQSRVNPSCRGTRTGPPPQVDLCTPVIILGRKELMIAAAGKILSLQEEVPTRLSTLKRVKYQEQDRCCGGNIPALHALGSSD